MADANTATTLVHEIGSMIVQDKNFIELPWDKISVVAVVDGGSVQVSGFAYEDGEDPFPEIPADTAIYDRFKRLREAMEDEAGRKWKSTLVQITRENNKIHFDFEYDDPMRWKVTPLNVDTKPRELEPK
jgi:hypothetical protein